MKIRYITALIVGFCVLPLRGMGCFSRLASIFKRKQTHYVKLNGEPDLKQNKLERLEADIALIGLLPQGPASLVLDYVPEALWAGAIPKIISDLPSGPQEAGRNYLVMRHEFYNYTNMTDLCDTKSKPQRISECESDYFESVLGRKLIEVEVFGIITLKFNKPEGIRYVEIPSQEQFYTRCVAVADPYRKHVGLPPVDQKPKEESKVELLPLK
jgi:hypothetical protein